GPAVLRCSQFVVKELLKGENYVKMVLDVLPNTSKDALQKELLTLCEKNPRKTIKNILKGIVPERFLTFILALNDIEATDHAANISKESIQKLCNTIKQFTFSVHGSLPMEKAFVTGGGVSIKEIMPKTMQSKRMPRLFFCGEILDIHGYTGGYNITSALVTGRLAGMNAALAGI
ncbi:NAD(P)/FAD-dependent oxidoreductase, partial [Virgibacillus sp. LDC1]|nr:NAD(P)/FAD-dependent oxidoreductase [Virgibacillus sp. LDC1]